MIAIEPKLIRLVAIVGAVLVGTVTAFLVCNDRDAGTTPVVAEPKTGEDDWVLVKSSDNVFEVLMPSAPVEGRTASGALTLTAKGRSGDEYDIIAINAPPDDEMARNVERILDALQDGVIGGLRKYHSVTVISSAALPSKWHPAREVKFRLATSDGPATRGVAHIYYVSMRYVFVMRYLGSETISSNVERFFSSFKLVGVDAGAHQ